MQNRHTAAGRQAHSRLDGGDRVVDVVGERGCIAAGAGQRQARAAWEQQGRCMRVRRRLTVSWHVAGTPSCEVEH